MLRCPAPGRPPACQHEPLRPVPGSHAALPSRAREVAAVAVACRLCRLNARRIGYGPTMNMAALASFPSRASGELSLARVGGVGCSGRPVGSAKRPASKYASPVGLRHEIALTVLHCLARGAPG